MTTTLINPRKMDNEQLQARLDLRRGSRTSRHANRKRAAKAGKGKGGRAGARRAATANW